MKGHWPLLALLGLVIGLFLGMDLRTGASEQASLSYQRFVAMTGLLQQQQDLGRRLLQEIAALKSAPPHGVAAAALKAQAAALKKARAAAGRTPVRGPGIKLWLNDSIAPAQIGVNPDEYLIHDQDLLVVVNDLRAAGARAISINGLRLLATTDVRCAGAVVSIGPVRTSIPVTILAQGNPNRLAAGLSGPTGELRLLSLYGIRIRLTRMQSLVVPAYRAPSLGGE